jgi:flagellar basal body rod protein FlgC
MGKMRALSIANSGLAAASLAYEVSARNVANINTQSAPARANPQELMDGGVRVTISPQARALASGAMQQVDLVGETATQMTTSAAYRANLKVIEAIDRVFNRVLEISWGQTSS